VIRRAKPPWAEIAILAVAVILRLWALDVKPAHFDEGVNGWFADQMTEQGYYRYDPTNYHGPLHMYAVFVSQTVFGRNLWALRLPAVLASVLAVWALLRLAPHFGKFPARFAALAMAVSPAYVFYGRYSIHESWLVLFLVVTLYGILGLWQFGSRRALWAVAGGLTGLVLTKETYFIHIGCFLLAFPSLWIWQRVVPSRPDLPRAGCQWRSSDLWKAVAASVLVTLLFYSGFLLDFGAVRGLYETYAAWFATGVTAGGHEKTSYEIGPFNYYWLALMARYEWPALAGVGGCVWAMGRVDARVRYAAIFGAGVLIAYSIIPYKTPWCVISLIWPFYLVAGAMLGKLAVGIRYLMAGLLIAASLPPMVRLNFQTFDDDSEPYVYVQTYAEIDNAVGPLLKKAADDPRFYHAPGKIFLESYYPIPWILGDFTGVGYFKELDVPEAMDPAFVLCSVDNAEAVQAALLGNYYRRDFRLRSGMEDGVAFFRYDDFRDFFGGTPDVSGGATKEIHP
jgi:uncharacterized protein (TIGR03663 family)